MRFDNPISDHGFSFPDIASFPDQIRGFGHVKEKNLRVAEECKNNLMNAFNE